MNQENNTRAKERVKQMAKALCDKDKCYLIIECEAFKLCLNSTLKMICGYRAFREAVSQGRWKLLHLVLYFTTKNSYEFNKVMDFFNAKYPHGIFLFHDYVLGVANLTAMEIDNFLAQVGVEFGYCKLKADDHITTH